MASTDKAYGDQETLPYDERLRWRDGTPTTSASRAADLIAYAYAVSYGLPVAITRCGNFYGGGDLNWNRIVPGTIRSVLRGERAGDPLRRHASSATTSTSRTRPTPT